MAWCSRFMCGACSKSKGGASSPGLAPDFDSDEEISDASTGEDLARQDSSDFDDEDEATEESVSDALFPQPSFFRYAVRNAAEDDSSPSSAGASDQDGADVAEPAHPAIAGLLPPQSSTVALQLVLPAQLCRSWGYPGDQGARGVRPPTGEPDLGVAPLARHFSASGIGAAVQAQDRGTSLEFELASCERLLCELELSAQKLHAEHVSKGTNSSWAQLRSNLLSLSRRLDNLHADAFEAGCSRAVPGAMTVFESAGSAIERVANVLRVCDEDVGGPAVWPLPKAY